MFQIWELLNGVVNDRRVGNFWTNQKCWTIYIIRRLEDYYGFPIREWREQYAKSIL